MADEQPTPRMFTEGEHYAMQDAAIARETAEAASKIAELESANAELSTKVDVLETEKAQALSRAEEAERAFEQYKTEQAEREAAAARKDARVAEVAAANPHLDLKEESEEGKARVQRIVAMKDEDYAGYLADMKAVGAAASGEGLTPGAPPRESAALTPTPTPGDDKKATVGGVFAAARAARKGD